MSTHALPRRPAASRPALKRPDFARLVRVELRKMTDTRAGFWLLTGIGLLTLAVVAISLLTGDAADHTTAKVFNNAVQPAGLLLPVVGVLLVASEWSQRTAVVTFALVPDRGRVLASKFAAGIVLAVIAVLFARIATTAGVAISEGGFDGDAFDLKLAVVGQAFVYTGTAMLIGVAFGAMFLASAPAIVLFYVLPTAFSALGELSFFEEPAKWLDQSRTMGDMAEQTLSGTEWGRVGTSLLLWMVLPMIIGWWRFRRAEVG